MSNPFVLSVAMLTMLVGISGCASVPLSTAMALSSMTPQSLAQVDPAEILVRVSVPVGFEIDAEAARLRLELEGPTESRSGEMSLSRRAATTGTRDGGWFAEDVQVSTVLLALSPDGVRELQALQRLMLDGDSERATFSVEARFARSPPNVEEVVFWVDLRLAPDDPFLPLIDGAKVRFGQASARP